MTPALRKQSMIVNCGQVNSIYIAGMQGFESAVPEEKYNVT